MKASIIVFFVLVFTFKIDAFPIATDSIRFNNIHIVPSTLLDRNPRLRMGYEWVKGRNALSIDLGLGNYNSFKYMDYLLELNHFYQFFEFRLERKRFFGRYNKGFIAIEAHYFKLKKALYSGGFYTSGGQDDVHPFSYADFEKKKFGLNFKLGLYSISSKSVVFDLYTGFGLAIRSITYSNVVDSQTPKPLNYEYTIKLDNIPGSFIFPQLCMGLKFGIIHNNHKYL